jgi:hypothetical protein
MQQVAPLFDDFVGSREQCSQHFEAERFGGLDVEHGFVFRRSLHREVGWFLAFQDVVVQSRAQAYVFNVFGWLAEAARG